jgi:protein-S-isoprenylcysteine O-methyltransferase Ste14
MEKALMTVLPLAFLAHLRISELVMARGHVDMDGRPPIAAKLFYAGKYLVVPVWLLAASSSWGIGLPLIADAMALRWAAVGLWVSGFAVLSLGRVNLGRHVRIGIPDEETALHTDGLFRLSRNPMYLGLAVTIVAAMLYTQNPAVLALGAFVIAVHHRIILAEERWLVHAFGPSYERYRQRVPRYL